MKRICIYFLIFILTVMSVWIFYYHKDTIASRYHDMVIVRDIGEPSEERKQEIETMLDTFAVEYNATFLCRFFKEDRTDQDLFLYQKYGTGKVLPYYASRLGTSDHKQYTYILLSPNIDVKDFVNLFKNLGYQTLHVPRLSYLGYYFTFYMGEQLLLIMLILHLTFLSVAVVQTVRYMKTAGIRVLAGENRTRLGLELVGKDLQHLLVGIGILLAIATPILLTLRILPPEYLGIYLWSYVFFAIATLLISAIVTSVTLSALGLHNLSAIIKGKLPVKRLMVTMFIGQIFAVTLVGYTLYLGFSSYSAYLELNHAESVWSHYTEYVNVDFHGNSFGVFRREGTTEEEKKFTEQREKLWFDLLLETLETDQAFFIDHNLLSYLGTRDPEIGQTTIHDHHPLGNTIYVSPNYLRLTALPIDEEFMEKVKSLKPGEFGILLPESLKSEESHFLELYGDWLRNNYFSRNPETNLVLHTSYFPNQTPCFVFNSHNIGATQFLVDPVIVVMTPNSTLVEGEKSNVRSWVYKNRAFYFKDEKTVKSLIAKYGAEDIVRSIRSSYVDYIENTANQKSDAISISTSGLLGFLASIVMFSFMNTLYFTEFRRDILIKRISGMHFFAIHKNFLSMQATCIVISCTILYLLLRMKVPYLLVTLVLFLAVLLLTLWNNYKKELEPSIQVIKGQS